MLYSNCVNDRATDWRELYSAIDQCAAAIMKVRLEAFSWQKNSGLGFQQVRRRYFKLQETLWRAEAHEKELAGTTQLSTDH